MKSKNIAYLAKLDHLRFFAAFLVIVYHYYHFQTGFYNGFESPARVAKSIGSALIIDGHVGVSLFLVLSGFIFSAITYGKDINYGAFLGNRLLRIMPLYGVAIGVAALLSGPTLGQLIASLTFTAGLVPGVDEVRITPHLWTIAVEFQFYLLFPFLAIFMRKYGFRYIAGLIGFMICVRFLLWCASDASGLKQLVYSSLIGRLDQFLIGMVAGAIYRASELPRGMAWFRKKWSPLVGLVVVVATIWAFHRAGGHYHIPDAHWFWIIWTPLEATAWAIGILTYGLSSFALPERLSRPLAFLGTLSFSLYVNHWIFVHNTPFHRWIPQLSDNYPINALLSCLLVVLPLIILMSWLTYTVIERPFFELRRSYLKIPTDPDNR